MGNADVMMLGCILAVGMSAIFGAVFNPPPPKPGVVGIDLGTTFSVIAIFHNGSVEVVPDHQNKKLTPSVVAFAGQGKVLVGHEAQQHGLKYPGSMVFDAKRYIGHKFAEETVQRDRELVPFEVVDVDGQAHMQVKSGEETLTMSPQTVGSHVLRKMKRQVEDYIGRPVLKAVLAVPADFTEEQRNATVEAGRMAGLDVMRIISEPTAAALAYGLQEMAAATILVYDFGGVCMCVRVCMCMCVCVYMCVCVCLYLCVRHGGKFSKSTWGGITCVQKTRVHVKNLSEFKDTALCPCIKQTPAHMYTLTDDVIPEQITYP